MTPKEPTSVTSPATTADRIRYTGNCLLRLSEALSNVASIQWERPLGPSTRGDDGPSSGGVSNPTADIATDPRRLQVRAAVLQGEAVLDDIATSATRAAEDLEGALAGWAGVRY